MAQLTHLLYLHGFRSSPQSAKAVLTQQWLQHHAPQVQWWCPALPASPLEACALIDRETAQWPSDTMAVIGSSLGGFYATWLAQRRNCRAVLLNPAVFPARDLARHIGEHPCWHDPSQRIFFEARYVQQLEGLSVGAFRQPEKVLAVLGTHDEVLSFQEMQARYADCAQLVVQGGDHGLSSYADLLPEVMRFVHLA
jgi:predicted esterase YcpF (UPF0227 family)